MTIREEVIAELKAHGCEREEYIFGCDDCGCTAETCDCYYDPYNIDGDCLAEK